MVAKFTKKAQSKISKNSHRRRKKSPSKSGSAANFISSINKSLNSCKRRFAKFFSKLVRMTTTPTRKSKGYKILKTEQKDNPESKDQILVPKVLFFCKENVLPPLLSPEKKTIFLDLDETLIHSKPDPPPKRFDFVVRPRIDGEFMNFYVAKRPGVDAFLESVSKKYEVVVFTAGLKEYASLVLDRLDEKRVISHRLYRDSCKKHDGRFVKDLSEMGRDLKKVVIVDDNPNAYVFQPGNAIPVKPFTGDAKDKELRMLAKFFEGCDRFLDMRDAVKAFGRFKDYFD
ncbi:probable C-terminal domain small phosphatase [Mangifera indica]|uniref:probable C-terminal domain small phosphatase n=1 Tax=Mangifera indica TaxID=29780 RepID=UPI001CF97C10|nr:probable C-terminal domain small phosphatase [Mangifera indica]